MARMTPNQQRRLLNDATRQIRSQGRRGGIFSRLGRKFGPFGELLGILADILAGGRGPSRRDIQDAIGILNESGYPVQPAPPGPILEPPVQVPRRGGAPTQPTVPTPPVTTRRKRAAEPWPEEHTVQILPTRLRGAFESIPADITGFSPWLFFPASSNVHAALYDYENGVLYVQFRAEGKPIGYREGISICSGKAYRYGVRADVPGPIYSYGGAGRKVPPELFAELARARSAGKFVWDKLRECGSQWQHKFPYTLTDVPAGQNVPRKSTRSGLRVRSVPTVGLGRRSSRRSRGT